MKHLEPIAHLVPEIKDLYAEKKFNLIKELLADFRPEDLAESWYRFADEEKIGIFKLLEAKMALVFFENLEVHDQKLILKSLEENSIAPLLEEMPPSDIAELFQELPPRVVKRMVSLVRKEDAVKRIELMMTFEPETAGALMHPEFIQLRPRMTSRNALSVIHSVTRVNKRHYLRALYVTSLQGELLGAVTLADVVSAAPDSTLDDLMTSVDYFKLSPETDQEEVASVFAKYDLISAPVVDKENKLLGVILIDDIVDVIKQEATEDIAKMVGSSADEFAERSVFRVAWYRSPWLLATLFGQFMVFLVIRHFEYAIAEVIALASFLPLVPAMGGNVGSQSAMIMVRNMAIGQNRAQDIFIKVSRETCIGMVLGVLYGSATACVAYLLYGSQFGLDFSIVVGVAVWLAMTMAAAAGALGPLVLARLGIDPATAVGPMVTTTTDIIGVSIYFILGVLILVR